LLQLVVEIFGIRLWTGTKDQFLIRLVDDLRADKKVWVATVNPEFVVESRRDSRFFQILKEKTTYNVVDGVGLLWAADVVGKVKSLSEKISRLGMFFIAGKHRNRLITGVDLVDSLVKIASENEIPVFFWGGWEPEKVADQFLKKYPELIVGGYATDDFLKNLQKNGKLKKAIFFVALGMKKQELWIEESFALLPTGVVVGVGRSFDYYTGKVIRAPKWVRRLGMEWLFSAALDPARAKRQWKNLPEFIKMVCRNENRNSGLAG
jgi:N-acetylglucosaminyldiphosphoundecaprenol N-acetyl-beta-D-mannosaminyltransferase